MTNNTDDALKALLGLYADACGVIEQEYPKINRDMYPDYKRKFDRDMDYLEEQIQTIRTTLEAYAKIKGDTSILQWTGLYDKNNKKVMVGDWLDFDEKEFGHECIEQVPLFHEWKGEWPLSGCPSDVSQWRTAYKEPPTQTPKDGE